MKYVSSLRGSNSGLMEPRPDTPSSQPQLIISLDLCAKLTAIVYSGGIYEEKVEYVTVLNLELDHYDDY